MKKYYLWSLVILVIGTALAIFGAQNGGIKTINQEGNLLDFSRRPQIISGDQEIALVSGHSLPRRKNHSYQLTQPFQNVNLDVYNAQVVVQTGDRFLVRVTNRQALPVKVKVAHQQLSIADYDSHGAMDQDRLPNTKIYITVPASRPLNQFKIDGNDVQLTLHQLQLRQLRWDNDKTKLKLDHVQISEKMIADNDQGNYLINNSRLKQVNCDGDGLKAQISNSTLQQVTIDADTVALTCQKTQFLQHNRIQGDNGKLVFKDLNKNLGYSIRGEGNSIHYQHQLTKGNFYKRPHYQNNLHIAGDELQVFVD